jgi:hypothetical protein
VGRAVGNVIVVALKTRRKKDLSEKGLVKY